MRDDDVEALGKLVRLADVPSLPWLPTRRGKGAGPARPISLATIHRWASVGVRGVRLRTVRVGGALATTPAWLMDFFEALADPAPSVAPLRTRRQQKAARERAKRELERAGI